MVYRAVGLAERLPAVRGALHAGLIDSRRTQVIHRETVNVAAESAEAEWRYTVTVDGAPAHVGTTSRRPTASMKTARASQIPHLRLPGEGRMPSIGCDLDHQVAVADGGATKPCNLTPEGAAPRVPRCRKHHRAKHEAEWDHQVEDSQVEWVNPTDHRYQTGGRAPP